MLVCPNAMRKSFSAFHSSLKDGSFGCERVDDQSFYKERSIVLVTLAVEQLHAFSVMVSGAKSLLGGILHKNDLALGIVIVVVSDKSCNNDSFGACK